MNKPWLGLKHAGNPIMNAAGTARTVEEVQKLALSEVGAIVVGSMTLLERPGNSGDTFAVEPGYTFNSRGLPDRGYKYWAEVLPEMVRIAHDHGQLLIMSVAGMSPEEFGQLTEVALQGGADLVEENFGCPNVWGGGQQKQILTFCPEAREAALEGIQLVAGEREVITVKVSPFSDPFAIPIMAEQLRKFPAVRGVVTMNTFPNAYLLHPDGRPRIGPKFGGLAGPAVKPIGLGQVLQWRSALPENIGVIGVGGIETGQDMLDYERCGAALVQVASAYLHNERLDIFTRILAERLELTHTT